MQRLLLPKQRALMVNAYAKQIISQSTWQRNLPINKENKNI